MAAPRACVLLSCVETCIYVITEGDLYAMLSPESRSTFTHV